MTQLVGLTLKAALDGLKAKQFSAVELTQAHMDAIQQAKALNAFVLDTPERALEMAARVGRAAGGGNGRAAGRRRAGHQGPVLYAGFPLDGLFADPGRFQADL